MQPLVGDWANSTTQRVAGFVSGLGSSTVDGGVAFREWWMVHLVRLVSAVREFLTPSSGCGALYPLLFFVSGWCCISRVLFLHAVEMARISRVFRFSARCRVVGVVECIPRDYTHSRSEICAKQRYPHSRGFTVSRTDGIRAIVQFYRVCAIARLRDCCTS